MAGTKAKTMASMQEISPEEIERLSALPGHTVMEEDSDWQESPAEFSCRLEAATSAMKEARSIAEYLYAKHPSKCTDSKGKTNLAFITDVILHMYPEWQESMLKWSRWFHLAIDVVGCSAASGAEDPFQNLLVVIALQQRALDPTDPTTPDQVRLLLTNASLAKQNKTFSTDETIPLMDRVLFCTPIEQRPLSMPTKEKK